MGKEIKRKTAGAVNQKHNHNNRKASQCQTILGWLEEGNTITSYEAFLKFGCTKLTTRISELRKAGFNIIGEWEKTPEGARYMKYRIGESYD